jgi:3-dehydroquinate dehydratase/shikimate dehydrogenase
MVYNPEQTLLVKNARKRGCLTITGVQMFLRQAALQFTLFSDQEAPIELMHHVMKSTLGAIKM